MTAAAGSEPVIMLTAPGPAAAALPEKAGHDGRRHRPLGDQRGVRRRRAQGDPRPRPRPRARSTSTAAPWPSATRSAPPARCSSRPPSTSSSAPTRRPRLDHDVHRRRHGHRHDHRTDLDLSTGRVRSLHVPRPDRLVVLARRLIELPEAQAAFTAGELSEDQLTTASQWATRQPTTTPRSQNSPAMPPSPSCHGRCAATRSPNHRHQRRNPPARHRPRNAVRSTSDTPTMAAGTSRLICPVMRGRWWSGAWVLTAIRLFHEADMDEQVTWADALAGHGSQAAAAAPIGAPCCVHLKQGSDRGVGGPPAPGARPTGLAAALRRLQTRGNATGVGERWTPGQRRPSHAHGPRADPDRGRRPGPGMSHARLFPRPVVAHPPHRPLGRRRTHRHCQPRLPLRLSPSSPPPRPARHHRQRRRTRGSAVHRSQRPATQPQRPTENTTPASHHTTPQPSSASNGAPTTSPSGERLDPWCVSFTEPPDRPEQPDPPDD